MIRVLDGPLAPIACASQNFFQRCDDCPDQNACAVSLLMLHVRTAIANVLDNKNSRRASQLPGEKRKRGRTLR